VINRVYLKDLISFNAVELLLDRGLVVLSGPSGAGKSVLMNSILATFGHGNAEARLCEITLDRPPRLRSDAYALEEEITIKSLKIKKEKVRYYIDGQNISKKRLRQLFAPFVQYLSVRDKGGFESKRLIALIDQSLMAKNRDFKRLHGEYQKRYRHYKSQREALEAIKEQESKLVELIEFAEFEIEKITTIDPKVGEDEALLKIKHQLSRIDKVNDALAEANRIFELEESVCEVYRLLDKDNAPFVEMMHQLRADFEDIELLSEELAEINIEEVLDRLEKIATLKRRYGSIEGALAYVQTKREELAGYQNIEQDKSMLESFLVMEEAELGILAGKITQARQAEGILLEKALARYLDALKLPPLRFCFEAKELTELGADEVSIDMEGAKASTLSGGEFNRIRLALMVVSRSGVKERGVLILDEIDANVSGDESIAIANMIAKLAKVYQVFAISHQAHLASKADQHILVDKRRGESQAVVLDQQGRIEEISRIVGGENPDIEAIRFAKKLLNVR